MTELDSQANPMMRRSVAGAIVFVAVALSPAGLLATGEALAEPRRSLGHNIVGTSFPYHPGYFRFWFGDRDIGLLDRSYPLPGGSYTVNPDPVPPYPYERQFSRSRHVTGTDFYGEHVGEGPGEYGGAIGRFDVDGWYDWPPEEALGVED